MLPCSSELWLLFISEDLTETISLSLDFAIEDSVKLNKGHFSSLIELYRFQS